MDFAHVVNPLLMEERNGKKRLCHNLQYLNSFQAQSHFRMSTLQKDIQHIVRPGDEELVLDLEKAYYHVPASEASWPFLCFQTQDPEELLCATVLPFGAGLGPFVFHKIVRQITAFAGLVGFRVMSYLDDFLWASEPEKRELTFATWLLKGLGWAISPKSG